MIYDTMFVVHSWIEWVVMDNLSFDFVTKPNTRKNVNLTPISKNTLLKYMHLVGNAVNERIKTLVKDKLVGFVYDGWSDGQGKGSISFHGSDLKITETISFCN